MGPADLEIAQPKGVYYFGGAGNEGDNAHSLNIALSSFAWRSAAPKEAMFSRLIWNWISVLPTGLTGIILYIGNKGMFR